MRRHLISPSLGYFLAPYGIIFLICLFIVFSIPGDSLEHARLENASFVRQMRAAYSLLEGEKILQRLFWHWNTSSNQEEFINSPIHLSYPSVSYFVNALIAKASKDIRGYMDATKLIGFALLCGYGSVFYQELFNFYSKATNPQPKNQAVPLLLGLAGASLLVTNPSFLSLIVEPDFEDGLIFAIFISSFFLGTACPRIAAIFLGLGSAIYPLAAGAVLAPWILRELTCIVRAKATQTIKYTLNYRLVLADKLDARPVLIGFLTYILARATFVFLVVHCSSTTVLLSGSSPYPRMGLDALDSYYGGILGIARFLVPIAGIPKHIIPAPALGDVDMEVIWPIVNLLQLALTTFLLSIAGLLVLIKGYVFGGFKKYNLPTPCIASYFSILTFSVALILPQWSAVHFRLLARFYAPALSFALTFLLYKVYCKMHSRHYKAGIAIITALTWLLALEQYAFFGKLVIEGQ